VKHYQFGIKIEDIPSIPHAFYCGTIRHLLADKVVAEDTIKKEKPTV